MPGYFHFKNCLFYFDSLKVKLTRSFLFFYCEASGKTQSILLPFKMVEEAITYGPNINTLTKRLSFIKTFLTSDTVFSRAYKTFITDTELLEIKVNRDALSK